MQVDETSKWPAIIRAGFQPPDTRGMDLPTTALTVIGAVACHLEKSPDVREFLTKLPKGSGTGCPNDPIDEMVGHVARMAGVKGIDKSDPSINLRWMRKIMQPVAQFEREMFGQAIEQKIDRDELSAMASTATLIFDGIKLGEAVDDLFLKLFELLVVPYQALPAAERKAIDADLATQLPEYTRFVFQTNRDNGYHSVSDQQTWATALPNEIGEIVRIIDHMILCLSDDEKMEQGGMLTYLHFLRDAYNCRDISQLEGLWRAVDVASVKLSPRLPIIFVHGIETYNRDRCVQPELRVEIRVADSRDEIERVQQATVQAADEIFHLSPEMVERILQRLARTDIRVSIAIVRAGFNLNFAMSGQSGPNDQWVQDTVGGWIFVSPVRELTAVKIHKQLSIQHCDPESSDRALLLITAPVMRRHVIGHECFHPVGRSAETDAAMGDMGDELEEAKATSGGNAVDDLIDPSPEARTARVACTVTRIVRFFQKSMMTNASMAPYVRECMVLAITLMDAGIISLTKDGIHIDWDAATGNAWNHWLIIFVKAITTAYASQDPSRVKQLSAGYCGDSRLQSLIDWCQREIPELVAA